MADAEDEPTPDQTGGGSGGLVGWLTGGTAFVKALAGLLTAIGVLIGALAAAGFLDRGRSDGPTTGTTEEARATTEGTTVDEGSGFSTPPGLFRPRKGVNGRAFFENGTLVVSVPRPRRPFPVPAELEEEHDVAVTVSARRVSGSRDFGVGIICRYQGPRTYYLLSVLSRGFYNVVRYEGGKAPRSLTGITRSTAIPSDDFDLEARCVGDRTTILSLFVNDRQVARVQDDNALEFGGVGLRVGSGETGGVTCRFERFELRSL